MAETEGFEPSVQLLVRFLSRELVSATHPRLRKSRITGWTRPITVVLRPSKSADARFLRKVKNPRPFRPVQGDLRFVSS